MKSSAFLSVDRVTKRFGGILAVDECSFDLERGMITGLIGPNGSGKTTILNIITGFHRADSGHVLFEGKHVNKLKSYEVAKRGIVRTFQQTRVFKKMTVMENMLASYVKEDDIRQRALELLEYVGINHLRDEFAGNLSYGQQKLLEFSRALMLTPKLLLLDEPVAGVNPKMIKELFTVIRSIRSEGNTVLIVEHNIPFIMDISDTIIALELGHVIAHGDPEEVRHNEEVIKAYLGGGRREPDT